MPRIVLALVGEFLHWLTLAMRSHTRLAAENLFLRKQLAFYCERRITPRRLDDAARLTLVVLARFLEWRRLLTVVQPETLVRWHRQGFRLFWRWKSRRRGRPRIPVHLQALIAEMARANRTWGEERIAAELLLKLGISVSPRTVRRYMKRPVPSGRGAQTQMWSTFLRNHAREVLACDFLLTVTARFRLVYVFVVLDISTRRLVHWNVTEHPTAEWTVQQFRAFVTGDEPYRFVIHDRDALYSSAVDRALASMHLCALRTPVRTPQANAFCERLIGTARRECLDWLIVLNERHLQTVLQEWVAHYNQGRPHASLGPAIPGVPLDELARPNGHQIPDGHRIITAPILAGLHHEYRLEPLAA
jgi:putative transposase